jgi:hypothetical protein
MSDWIHNLPLGWMAVVIFGCTYLVAALIHSIVLGLAKGDRLRGFKGISAGLLSPLGIMFGLLVAFLASQVWGDIDRANAAVNRQASSLRAAVLLSASLPAESGSRLRGLIRDHIHELQTVEWPAMGKKRVSINMIPTSLAEALHLALTLHPQGEEQIAAQREISAALENALDARRQAILVSQSEVNGVKWLTLWLQAICALTAIALVHSDNRLAAGIALGLFSTAIAACILLIASHDRPFTGSLAVSPAPLLQVEPDSSTTELRR